MNDKVILLKDLIETSQFSTPQLKRNKIIQTLQRTEDALKVKLLCENVLNGDFGDLEEESIDDLIKAFSNEEECTNNKEQSLDDEIKKLKLELEAAQSKNNKLEEVNNKLKEVNNKLASEIMATSKFELIEVSDEDINELYIRYLKNAENSYNDAFIMDGIIPKTYFKIKEV